MTSPTCNTDNAPLKEPKLQQKITPSSTTSEPSKQSQRRQEYNVGLPGRLTKGAGTHLASWLQELSFDLSNVTPEEAYAWLLLPRNPRTDEILDKVRKHIGNENLGHNNPILTSAHSGELLVTKDEKSMRLWRSKDGTLLRVVSGCVGNAVAFSPTGQKIVTGYIGKIEKLKLWGPAGGSAVGCGKAKITTAKFKHLF